MIPCDGFYPDSHRPCSRPAGHADRCGALRIEFHRYPRPRPVTDWIDDEGGCFSGFELFDLALSPAAIDGHARAVCERTPEPYLVIGEDRREDGKTYLRYAANIEWIEAKTDYRNVAPLDAKPELVYICPDCEGRSGKHSKACKVA